ncbi:MAG: ATP-binding cassette domain-containing protein [Mariprofundaceae bacterium]|nr:ATP-binding cassette domain-containing protein [Mariprofundaceae bacterium]
MLKVKGLCKSFGQGGLWTSNSRLLRAAVDIDFHLEKAKTLAIVGESGSGKSTVARMVMRLLHADAGQVVLNDQDITHLKGTALREIRRYIQMVFQDPFASLNPRMRIGETVTEGLRVFFPHLNKSERLERAEKMLAKCGVMDAMQRYPHQFSGGQRQRIGIARALVVEPKVLVLDEPVSALDVSIQAQVINLLKELQSEHDLSYLFVSHDLSVVRHVADDVMVMFAGHVVERGSIKDVFEHPKHPYTKMLLDARPVTHPKYRQKDISIAVEVEAVAESGCVYRLRCPFAKDDCASLEARLVTDDRGVACLYPL